jgi:peptidoglycan/xylan/chitin deacetylase (PgdA/CDA1 family)
MSRSGWTRLFVLLAVAGCVGVVIMIATRPLSGSQASASQPSPPQATASQAAVGVTSGAPTGTPASGPAPSPSSTTTWKGPVPILIYHVIGTPPHGAPYPDLYVTRAQFAQEMAYLARHHYHPVTLTQLFAGWRGEATLPSKPVVLTFDDGYRSVVVTAGHVLRRHHWPGVLNLALMHLGPGRDLTVAMVDWLIKGGWEVASHTMTHHDLTTLDASRLWYEVHQSRVVLGKKFGVPVDFFCYPSGKYDAAAISAVRRAGYLAATTTDPGLARRGADPYTLARVRVDLGESLSSFAEGLELGYP